MTDYSLGEAFRGVLAARIGPNGLFSVLDGFKRTDAEIAAVVTPTNYSVPSHTACGMVLTQRYGVAGVGSATDDTAALRNAVLVALQSGAELVIQPTAAAVGIYVTGTINITGPISIRGSGYYASAILTNGTNDVFVISAGVQQVHIQNLAVAMAVPYTTTPNSTVAISINGTTATPCSYHTYRDLLLDGFGTSIKAQALQDSTIDNVFAIHCKNGIIAQQLSVAVNVSNCLLAGGLVAGSFGIQVGDDSAAAEGWNVVNSTIYGMDTGFIASGSQNHNISNCQFDHITNIGIYLNGGTIAATNCIVNGCWFGMFGAAGTGIFCHGVASPSVQLGNRLIGNTFYNYAAKTLTYGILIDGASDIGHVISGNTVRATTYDCRITNGSNLTVTGNKWLGPGYSATVPVVYGNDNTGTILAIPGAATIASAANIALPDNDSVCLISGVTNITSITAVRPRGPITLVFLGILTVTNGSNLRLSSNFVTTANDTLTLVCDGGAWYEVGRSVN